MKCAEPSPDWNPAWHEFQRRFSRFIVSSLYGEFKRIGGYGDSEELYQTIKDLEQEVYIKLLRDGGKALKEFKGDHHGSWYAFLKIVAINAVKNYVRLQKRDRRTRKLFFLKTQNHLNPEDSNPLTNDTQEELEVGFFKQKILAVLRQCYRGRNLNRDLFLFEKRFFDGLSPTEISARYKLELTLSGIETIISRVKKALENFYFL